MADRSRGDGWWQASDGKWYPPDLLDAPRQQFDTTEIQPVVPGFEDKIVSPGSFVQAALGAVALANAALVITGLSFASHLRDSDIPLIEDGRLTYPAEAGAWLSASAFQLLAMVVAAVAVIVWMHRTSKALSSRGATDRRWSPGWAIGGWFIPFANLVIPKLVFGEMERIAQVPYRGEPVGLQWKSFARTVTGDLWWFLWLSGNLVSVVGNLGQTFEVPNSQIATYVSIQAIGSAILVVAAIVFIMAIRAVVRSANA